MKLTFIIFGLLFGSVIQAYPSWEPDSDEDEENHHSSHSDSSISHLVPPENKEKCEKNLEWFKNGTETTKRLYDEYYLKLRMINLSEQDSSRLKPQHDQVEHYLAESLEKYDQERNKTLSISNSTALLISCAKQMDWQKLLQHNLTGVAKNMHSDILNIADRLNISKEMRDDLDKTLGRVVNFLFIMDMTKNTFKDVGSLLKTAYEKTDEYIAKKRAQRAKKNGEAETAKGEEAIEKEKTADYDEKALEENNEMDNELGHTVDDLAESGEIREAQKQFEERMREEQRETEEQTNQVEEGVEAENYFAGREG